MLIRLILIFLGISLSFGSPPTNCGTCQGHFYLFHELDTEEKKIESIEKYCAPDRIHMLSFEDALCDWVKQEGIKTVLEEVNKCTEKSCIRKLCSKLSGQNC